MNHHIFSSQYRFFPLRGAGAVLCCAAVLLTLSGCQSTTRNGQLVHSGGKTLKVVLGPRTSSSREPVRSTQRPSTTSRNHSVTTKAVTSTSRKNEPRAPELTPEIQQALLEAPVFEPTAAGHRDLLDRLRDGFGLNLAQSHPRIDAEAQWFARNNDYLDRCTERASKYLHYVVGELEKRNMPLELALLPIVESAFNPYAYSRSHASGMWQFIPSTGKDYGLRQDWWYDGRRDIVESTRAALDYLQKLHAEFNGDWLLALASYNAGERRVGNAVRANRKAGKPTDFFSLKLPRETTAYVPKLLAVARIMAAPEHFGVQWQHIPNKPYFAEVDAGGQVDLGTVASLAGISMDELYALNPGYTRWSTPPEGPHRVLVPVGHRAQLAQGLAALPLQARLNMQAYTVRKGDTLSGIANRHNSSIHTIRAANQLASNNIHPGNTLLIPGPGKSVGNMVAAHTNPNVRTIKRRARRSGTTYTVRNGDSLWKIARRYQVTTGELAAWNGLRKDATLRPGKKLKIRSVGTTVASAGGKSRKVDYRVKGGDSLWTIAKRHKVNVSDIRRWNSLSSSRHLKPGQLLTLFVR